MRQLRAANVPLRAAVLALSGWLALFGASCQSLNESLYGRAKAPAGDSRGQATPISVGAWTTDYLHCAKSRCERWYAVEIPETSVLKVDVYAPFVPGEPDCKLVLESAEGDALAARSGRVKSRRQLRFEADPGRYLLKIVSSGSGDAAFEYEMHVRTDAGGQRLAGPKAAPRRAPEKRATPKRARRAPPPDVPLATREPVSAPEAPAAGQTAEPAGPPDVPLASGVPATLETSSGGAPLEGPPETPAEARALPPQPTWIVAEVLDVEETGGEAQGVMIEAGEPDGLVRGMQGVLVEGETEIGRIEITDVYRNGSRARIVGPLSAPISFDTLSRIEVPPDGE